MDVYKDMAQEDLLSLHDIVSPGATIVINDKKYIMDEVMMVVNGSEVFFVARYMFEDKNTFLCALNVLTKEPIPLGQEQLEQYRAFRQLHGERLISNSTPDFESLKNFNEESTVVLALGENVHCLLGESQVICNVKSKLSINNRNYCLNSYSILLTFTGDSLVALVSEDDFLSGLNKEALYNEIECIWNIGSQSFGYLGNVVRIKKDQCNYICYIQPYSIEVMQSKMTSRTIFENIKSPFSIMDFIVNHSDSDVKGIVYPNSDQKNIQSYLVVGVLENLQVNIEDCVIGNVRVGGNIDVSDEFKSQLSTYEEKEYTLIWVILKTDSLYNAFDSGKRILQSTVEFLTYMVKNDIFNDWYGTCANEKGYWDIQNHNPRLSLGKTFYIENCILGESVTLNGEGMVEPHALTISEDEEYLFEHEWVENFFRLLETEDSTVMRLQHAIKWIIQAWNTNNKYDRVIYCSMALEFVVNGEKGKNIFQEYAEKTEKKNISKEERRELVNKIISGARLDTVSGIPAETLEELNASIQNMIKSKLGESSFGTKLDNLIERLNIPINCEERKLLTEARAIRNQLIHGIEMKSITTLEAKKLCGITSRLLMYKLQDKL